MVSRVFYRLATIFKIISNELERMMKVGIIGSGMVAKRWVRDFYSMDMMSCLEPDPVKN